MAFVPLSAYPKFVMFPTITTNIKRRDGRYKVLIPGDATFADNLYQVIFITTSQSESCEILFT